MSIYVSIYVDIKCILYILYIHVYYIYIIYQKSNILINIIFSIFPSSSLCPFFILSAIAR